MIPRTVKQTGIFVAAKLITKIISFFAFLYIAREIGPDNLGVYTYLTSLAVIFAALSHLGILGEVMRRGKKIGRDAVESSSLTYILSTVLGSLVVASVVLYRGYTPLLAILTALFLFSKSVYDFLRLFHFIKGRVRYVTVAAVGERILFTVLIFLMPQKTTFLLLTIITSTLVMEYYLYLRAKFKPKRKIDRTYISLPFFLNALFLSIGERIPVIFYDIKFSIFELGIFGVALTFYYAGSQLFNEGFKYVQVRAGFMTEAGDKKFKWAALMGSVILLISFILFGPLLEFFVNFVCGAKYPGAGGIFFRLSLSLPALVLAYYPRAKMVYQSPWIYALSNLILAIVSSAGALMATSIELGAIFYSLSYWISAIAWWVLMGFSQNRTPRPSI